MCESWSLPFVVLLNTPIAVFGAFIALFDAAFEGAKLRLRPILMTSFALIFGCVPLWRATGSGAIARNILGTTVIGGMLAASLLAAFTIPVCYYLVEKFAGKKTAPAPVAPAAPVSAAH